MKILSLSEAKMKLSELIDGVVDRDEEIMITRNGSPAAVLLSPEEYESWQETLAIRGDPVLRREVRAGIKAVRRTKKTYSLAELFDDEEDAT